MREIVLKIRNAISVSGIAKTDLADEAGVHRNSLVNIDSNMWNPRLNTLEALSEAVDRIKARRA